MTTQTLKPSWKTWRFEQMATNTNVRIDNPSESGMEHYVGLEHLDPDSLRIRRWGSPSDVEAGKLFFKTGDIIFAKRRAYQRKLGVAEFDGICSAHAMVLRAKPDVVLPEFLPFFMQSDLFMNRAVEISVGSLSPTINWKMMAVQEFALPPMDEQKRIVDLLLCLKNSADAFEQAQQAGKQVVSSYAVNQMSVARARYPVRKLEDVCVRITDGTHQPPKFAQEGVPFLLISNLSSGIIDWSVEKWISESDYRTLTRSFKPQRGDVLLTLVGSFGVPVHVDWDQEFSFQRHIGILRPDMSQLRSQFLTHFLRSPVGQWQCTRGAQGLAQKSITLSALKGFEIPLPPMDVQDKFVDEVQSLELAMGALGKRKRDSDLLLRAVREEIIGSVNV